MRSARQHRSGSFPPIFEGIIAGILLGVFVSVTFISLLVDDGITSYVHMMSLTFEVYLLLLLCAFGAGLGCITSFFYSQLKRIR